MWSTLSRPRISRTHSWTTGSVGRGASASARARVELEERERDGGQHHVVRPPRDRSGLRSDPIRVGPSVLGTAVRLAIGAREPKGSVTASSCEIEQVGISGGSSAELSNSTHRSPRPWTRARVGRGSGRSTPLVPGPHVTGSTRGRAWPHRRPRSSRVRRLGFATPVNVPARESRRRSQAHPFERGTKPLIEP